jgi:hypothetical protein
LTLRASSLGGHGFQELGSYPRLIIETAVPEPSTFAFIALAGLTFMRRRHGA